ncbi:MAG: hypothetical protein HGA85_08240, partial [Nanoarchaeota archaeon]|nr:hypothetical protein [Nanoarchaeota archaeon]
MKKYFAIFFLLLLVSACTEEQVKPGVDTTPDTDLATDLSLQSGSGEMKKFSSAEEVSAFLQKNAAASGNNYGYDGRSFGGVDMALAESSKSSMVPSAGMAQDDGASDYSTTNIQVEGVDEPDFIKNDGKYIYTLSNSQLVIVKAYPATAAEILSKTEIEGYPTEMFLSGDKVIIFVTRGDEELGFETYDAIPRQIYRQKAHILIYDVSNKDDPELVEDIDAKGYYVAARIIGDHVYIVS